jgi:hypothetical protein
MAETVHAPQRPTSRVARVYPLLRAGLPAYRIGEQLGLTGTQLTEAIRGNYRLGYVPLPPPDIRRAQHRANTSAARGGIALLLEPYLRWDLTARQTQVALQAEGNPSLSLRQISSFYSRARHRQGVPRPTAELTVEAQRDKRRTEAELLQIVRDRETAAAALPREGLSPPSTIAEWRRLEVWLEVRDAQVTRLRAILPPAVAIPAARGYRAFLVEFWEKADAYHRDGILSLAYNPYRYLPEQEPPRQALRALAPQLRAIQQQLHLSDEEMRKLLRAA